MTKQELRELIKSIIHEQLGDMASTGLTSDDGNNVTSQRPFEGDGAELSFYKDKGAPYGGAEGNHYLKEPAHTSIGINTHPNTKF